jgi:hypothetical protein
VVSRTDEETYTLIVLRARRPQGVELRRLQKARLGSTEAALLVQR